MGTPNSSSLDWEFAANTASIELGYPHDELESPINTRKNTVLQWGNDDPTPDLGVAYVQKNKDATDVKALISTGLATKKESESDLTKPWSHRNFWIFVSRHIEDIRFGENSQK